MRKGQHQAQKRYMVRNCRTETRKLVRRCVNRSRLVDSTLRWTSARSFVNDSCRSGRFVTDCDSISLALYVLNACNFRSAAYVRAGQETASKRGAPSIQTGSNIGNSNLLHILRAPRQNSWKEYMTRSSSTYHFFPCRLARLELSFSHMGFPAHNPGRNHTHLRATGKVRNIDRIGCA